jgi:UDP-glucose 4-epimerase
VFNVASGVETSLLDLANALMKVMGAPHLKPEFGPERKVNAVPRRLADTSKAADMLGFQTEIGMEDGLRDLVEWWRNERAALPTAAE